MLATTASSEEAAAVIAALERFMRETAPPPVSAPAPPNQWQQSGPGFTLAWADSGERPPGANGQVSCGSNSDLGVMSFNDSSEGLINTNWNSCPPPSNMPLLCPGASGCANSLSSTLYDVIWG